MSRLTATVPRRLEAAWHRRACGGQRQRRHAACSLGHFCAYSGDDELAFAAARAGSTRCQADRAQLSKSLSTGVLAGAESIVKDTASEAGAWAKVCLGHKLRPVDVLAPIGVGQSMLICGPKVGFQIVLKGLGDTWHSEFDVQSGQKRPNTCLSPNPNPNTKREWQTPRAGVQVLWTAWQNPA